MISALRKHALRESLLHDFSASLVVFLVALPLSIGIAIASGLPPASGIITAIIGGIIVSSLSGCALQISGPAAGLAVLVTDLVAHHSVERLGMVVMLAGALQMIAGATRMAQWFRAVPPSVMHGMLSGIGILICAAQIHLMVDDGPKGTAINNIIQIPTAFLKSVVPDAQTSHQEAALVGIGTICCLLLWQKFVPKKLKWLPGSLVAVVLAAGICSMLNLPVQHVNIPDNIWNVIHLPTLAWLQQPSWQILIDALAVAFIASAETLLTAASVDKMHQGERTNYGKELFAQGVGNMLCGFVGVGPLTGVIVRSGVNVSAGARSRLSGVMHGCWLLLFVSTIPFAIRLIPMAALAALLVYTGFKLINWQMFRELLGYGRSEAAIYVATIATILCTDLLTGVVVGLVLSAGKLLYMFSHFEIEIRSNQQLRTVDMWLHGSATFLTLPKLAQALDSIGSGCELRAHLDGLQYIDHACLDLLLGWETRHKKDGGHLIIDWNRLETANQPPREACNMC